MNTSAGPIWDWRSRRGWLLVFALLSGCATPPVSGTAVFSDARREFWLNRFDNLPEPSEVDRAWARFLLCELPPEHRPEGCEK